MLVVVALGGDALIRRGEPLPVSVLELFAIFLLRTFITVPVIALVASFLF